MPKLDCPLGDFTSTSDQTPTAAKELADHLVKAHCKTPFPIDPNLIDVADSLSAEARVKAGPAQVDVQKRGR